MKALENSFKKYDPEKVAYEFTKGYFSLGSEKSREAIQLPSAKPLRRNKSSEEPKKLTKLLDRAKKSGVNEEDVSKAFLCVWKLGKQKVELSAENTKILHDIVVKDYPNEKLSKVPLVFWIALAMESPLTHQSNFGDRVAARANIEILARKCLDQLKEAGSDNSIPQIQAFFEACIKKDDESKMVAYAFFIKGILIFFALIIVIALMEQLYNQRTRLD